MEKEHSQNTAKPLENENTVVCTKNSIEGSEDEAEKISWKAEPEKPKIWKRTKIEPAIQQFQPNK